MPQMAPTMWSILAVMLFSMYIAIFIIMNYFETSKFYTNSNPYKNKKLIMMKTFIEWKYL